MHLSWKLCVRSQLLVRSPVQIPASKQNKQTTEEPVLCAGLAVQWVDNWRADIDPWHQARRPPSCKKPAWNKVVCGGGEGRQRGKWKSRGVGGGGGGGGGGLTCWSSIKEKRSQGAADGATFSQSETVVSAVFCSFRFLLCVHLWSSGLPQPPRHPTSPPPSIPPPTTHHTCHRPGPDWRREEGRGRGGGPAVI